MRSDPERSGIRRAGFSLLANAGYAAFQWLVVAGIARLAGVQSVGEYSLTLAISAPVFMAFFMRLRFIHGADVGLRFAYESYLRVRALAGGAAVIVVALLAWWLPVSRNVATLLLVVACVKWLEGIEDGASGELQRAQRMDLVAVGTILSGLSLAALFLGVLYFTDSMVLACVAIALSRLIVLLAVQLPWSARHRLRASKADAAHAVSRWETLSFQPNSSVFSLATAASPLAIAALLDSLNGVIPRYVLEYGSGSYAVGVYTLLIYFSYAGFLATGAFAQSRSAQMGTAVVDLDLDRLWEEARRLALVGSAIAASGALVLTVVGDVIVAALYGPGIQVSRGEFLLLMLGGAFSYISLVAIYLLSAMRARWEQVILYCANTAAILSISGWLVARHGVTGALLAVAVANGLQAAISYLLVRRASRRLLWVVP